LVEKQGRLGYGWTCPTARPAYRAVKTGRKGLRKFRLMKTRLIFCGVLSSLLSFAALGSAQDTVTPNPVPTPNRKADLARPAAPLPAELKDKLKAAAANLSPEVMQIVRMSDAGTDPSVIQAFVENSTTAYTPRAEEIIYLHDHGIPNTIITAMIQHGAKLREQVALAQANAAASQQQPVTVTPPSSESTYAVPPSAPTYVSSPTYVYPSPSYYPSYAYDYYPYYSYWPYSGFSFYVSGRPFFYGHSHFGHGRSFVGDGHFGHSGGAGFHFSSPYTPRFGAGTHSSIRFH